MKGIEVLTPRRFCRACGYDSGVDDPRRCSECGGEDFVRTLKEVRCASPWWARGWPLYVALLTAMPVWWHEWSSGNLQDRSAVLHAIGLIVFWWPPFAIPFAIGWNRKIIAETTPRLAAQICATIAIIIFPGFSVAMELINPTDAQSGLVLIFMPLVGSLSAAVGAAIGCFAARIAAR